MTTEQKIEFILDKLQQDNPTSSTGKILRQLLIVSFPTLAIEKINAIVLVLGGNPNEELDP